MTEDKNPILIVRGLKKSYAPPGDTPKWMYAAGYGIGFGILGPAGALILGGDLTEVIRERYLTSGRLPVLNGVDLDVQEGETLAIVGPSGAGKSTLLHLMGALEPPSDGAIIYRGRDLARVSRGELDEYRNKRVGFVFQFYYLIPELTALQNVLVPAMIQSSVLGWYAGAKARATDRARELLRQVGLESRAHHKPTQLSGGEQQRVAIARALLLEPELLLCDEPTGNLDRRTGEEVLELLWHFKKQGKHTYVIVTHDMRLAAKADRTVEIEDGKVKAAAIQAEPAFAVSAKPSAQPVDPALLDTDAKAADTPPPPGTPTS